MVVAERARGGVGQRRPVEELVVRETNVAVESVGHVVRLLRVADLDLAYVVVGSGGLAVLATAFVVDRSAKEQRQTLLVGRDRFDQFVLFELLVGLLFERQRLRD